MIAVMKLLKHPSIVRLEAVFETRLHMYIVLEKVGVLGKSVSGFGSLFGSVYRVRDHHLSASIVGCSSTLSSFHKLHGSTGCPYVQDRGLGGERM
jgi:hypothetical protein